VPPDPASDSLTQRITFIIDPAVEPGNVLPALAQLLIGLAEEEAQGRPRKKGPGAYTADEPVKRPR
jgi:hypothetical protein